MQESCETSLILVLGRFIPIAHSKPLLLAVDVDLLALQRRARASIEAGRWARSSEYHWPQPQRRFEVLKCRWKRSMLLCVSMGS